MSKDKIPMICPRIEWWCNNCKPDCQEEKYVCKSYWKCLAERRYDCDYCPYIENEKK